MYVIFSVSLWKVITMGGSRDFGGDRLPFSPISDKKLYEINKNIKQKWPGGSDPGPPSRFAPLIYILTFIFLILFQTILQVTYDLSFHIHKYFKQGFCTHTFWCIPIYTEKMQHMFSIYFEHMFIICFWPPWKTYEKQIMILTNLWKAIK